MLGTRRKRVSFGSPFFVRSSGIFCTLNVLVGFRVLLFPRKRTEEHGAARILPRANHNRRLYSKPKTASFFLREQTLGTPSQTSRAAVSKKKKMIVGEKELVPAVFTRMRSYPCRSVFSARSVEEQSSIFQDVSKPEPLSCRRHQSPAKCRRSTAARGHSLTGRKHNVVAVCITPFGGADALQIHDV